MKKARTMLIIGDPFYGALSMRMKMRPINCKNSLEEAMLIRSCATDGKKIVYDPQFIDKLDLFECKGLLAHEVSHIALKHHFRRGKRNWHIWNAACDHIIDPILHKAGFKLPPVGKDDDGNPIVGHFDEELTGKSVEEAYEILLARAKQEAKQKKFTLGANKPDNDDDNQDGSGLEPDKHMSEPEDEIQDETQDNLENESENKITTVEPRFPAEKGTDNDDLLDIDLESLDIPNIPGMGVVLDAPINLADKTQVDKADQELTIAIEQAVKAAKMHGSMPGDLDRIIGKRKQHKIDWRIVLFDFLEKSLDRGDYSWMKPSRRYLGHGMILPGLVEEEDLPQVVVICDTSGSVSNEELGQYGAEISNVLEEFRCTFKVGYFDTQYQGDEDFSHDDLPIILKAKGGGGTRFKPAFDWIKEEKIEAEAIIFFTDMDAWDWNDVRGVTPTAPVLWLDSYGDIVDNDNFELPFGRHIRLDLDS
jgi:predicted metal-dependent peptidase